jgi:glycosyltransferase involved in cell wall biosynthesis
MRWLMVSQDTPRDVLGGTELYVRRLSDALLQRGAEISWAYYSEGEPGLAEDGADGDGIAYYKISGRNQSRTREQAWQIDPLGLHEFRKVLELARPDCVHFNGFGRNQSPEHFAAAKQAGATVLMTYHSPGQSCSRWDLLYKGRDVCSGLIDIERCTDCALHRIGVPGPMRAVLSRADLSQFAQVLPHSVQHPFVRRKGLQDYRGRWQEGMAEPDKIVWHASWVRDLLLLNGIQEDRLYYLPLPPPESFNVTERIEYCPREYRKFVFIGRLTDIKGAHVLSEAVRLIAPEVKVEVLLVGARGPDEYLERIQSECAKDPRVRLVPPVAYPLIPYMMRDSDAVIVPSLWPETGPYTVLEALWTGTPVVGSDRAGIHELIEKWGGGILFEAGNASQLACLLTECDFQALRRNPTVFQKKWCDDFNAQLFALTQFVEAKKSRHDEYIY